MKMKTSRFCVLALVAIIGLLVVPSQSQILPNSVCNACAQLFRTNGCFTTPSLLCRLLAIKLNFRIGGSTDLCSQFPCERYGRTGNTCSNRLNCDRANVDLNGLCPTGEVCCITPVM